jgi:hypothetical protein
MTNNVFTMRNMFCPYKDYSSFLGGKLTMIKLCNYEIVLAKVSCMIFLLFHMFLLFIKLILLLMNFCRTIRVLYVYFIVYALFSCL